ncbi:hypothetical protein AB5N19_12678 [Seiridium cardinale]
MELASLRYLEWKDLFNHEKPFQVLIDVPEHSEDQRQSNLTFHDGQIEKIRDVRSSITDYKLDIHGFQFIRHDTKLQPNDFLSKKQVESKYLSECEALIHQNMNNVDRVHFYNWLVRDSDPSPNEGRSINLNDPLAKLGPARVVHIDQTSQSAVERVLMELPEQGEQLLRGRLQLINLWRPINGPVQMWPLALCDGRSVSKACLVESDRVRRNYTGGTTFVLEEPCRRWHYLSKQGVNEVTIFKNFDSKSDVTPYAPHTSFQVSSPPPNARSRQSIEVRAMVFTYAEDDHKHGKLE